jgi:thiamine transporter ThiT
MTFLSFAEGKKTYAAVLAGLLLGVLQGLDQSNLVHAHVPAWVDWILMFLGLGAARHAIQSQTAKTTDDVVALVRAILVDVSLPSPAKPTDPNSDTTGATVKTTPVEVRELQPIES